MHGGCVTSLQMRNVTVLHLDTNTKHCDGDTVPAIYQDITTVIQISDIILTLLLSVCLSVGLINSG